MPLYNVLQPLRHNGETKLDGVVELPLAKAKPLLALGVIAPAPKPTPQQQQKEPA